MLEKENSLPGRLRACRKVRGMAQAEFAKLIGYDRSYLSELENGKRPITEELAHRIRALELEPANVEPSNIRRENPTGEAPRIQRVPVVSWARAGQGGNFGDLANQIDEWLPSDCADPNAYALIIEGDSMSPNYLPGDRVIFLPNSEARNGDVVVARLLSNGEVYFKLFHRVGPNAEIVRLTSYNTVYPPLEYPLSAFRFIHPMYGFFRRGRR